MSYRENDREDALIALEDFVHAPWEMKNVENWQDPPPGPYRPVEGKEDDWFARRVLPSDQAFKQAVAFALHVLLSKEEIDGTG